MIKYDKLKNIDNEETYFDFKCTECSADGLKKDVFNIKPIGKSWKPDYTNNSDIKNLQFRKSLDALPTLRGAIELTIKEGCTPTNLSICCNSCNSEVNYYEKINISDIRKWMNKHLAKYMDLRKRD